MKSIPSSFYNDSLATLTDQYQLTMAYGYWKNQMHEKRASFNLFFRTAPFGGNFALAAGLEYVVNYLKDYHFDASDRDYLRSMADSNGEPLFDKGFISYLRTLEFDCTVEAVPEGTVVFPHEPIINITGPLIQCQLFETALLNMINFQTLIATNAAYIAAAAKGDKVMEFGLRRAQGIDGALTASRAAFIGGCSSTSNVLAGKLFGIPVVGTHAHSWIMSFPSELEAFRAYAYAMPDNCVFLVDTYDVKQGIENAIIVGKELRQRGYEMKGIRLDSGDLAELSIMARKMLDEADFRRAFIVASNDLDSGAVVGLKAKGAKIDVWGIGTKLVTSYDQPALGGVYKLGAIRNGDTWESKIKVSATKGKSTLPGGLTALRFTDPNTGRFVCDEIDDIFRTSFIPGKPHMISFDGHVIKIPSGCKVEPLLRTIFNCGKLIYPEISLVEIQRRAREQLVALDDFSKGYTVGLSRHVYENRERLLKEIHDRS